MQLNKRKQTRTMYECTSWAGSSDDLQVLGGDQMEAPEHTHTHTQNSEERKDDEKKAANHVCSALIIIHLASVKHSLFDLIVHSAKAEASKQTLKRSMNPRRRKR